MKKYLYTVFLILIGVFVLIPKKVSAYSNVSNVFGSTVVVNDSLHQGFDSMSFEYDGGTTWQLWTILNDWSTNFGDKNSVSYFVKQPINLVDNIGFLGMEAVVGDIILFNQTDIILYNQDMNVKAYKQLSELSGTLYHFITQVDKNEEYWLGYSDGYDVAYDRGYDDGSYGYDDAYDIGYDTAKNEFGYNDDGTIIPGQNAYDKGYSIATQESGELKTEIINFVPGVLGSIFMFFFQVGQIGILGITILDILGILVLISGLIFVIKLFF